MLGLYMEGEKKIHQSFENLTWPAGKDWKIEIKIKYSGK